jgi:hypothetical protein
MASIQDFQGPRKNDLSEKVPGFASDLDDLREKTAGIAALCRGFLYRRSFKDGVKPGFIFG